MSFAKIALSALFVSSFAAIAHAAPIPKDADAVGIDMKLEVAGKTVATPYDLLMVGETGTVTQKVDDHTSYVINVTPTLDANDHVVMSMAINKDVDGKMTLISSPKIITNNNETASIEQKDDKDPSHSFKMTVTPTL